MNVFDKFFTKYGYKFPKGYPDMNNEQDILLMESLIKKHVPEFSFSILKEDLLFEVTDREINANTKKAIDFLLTKSTPELGFISQSDKTRLGNPNKVEQEDIIKFFKNNLGVKDITTYGPNQGPNSSGKYTMYEMDTDQFGLIRIIVSGGKNVGEKYENDFVGKAKSYAGEPNNTLPNDLQTLYKTLGINNTKLKADDIEFTGATDTKRSLNLSGPQDIGETISDMTIKYGGKYYYISLKNVSGSGVYSGPNIPFIKYKKDGTIVYDESEKNTNPSVNLLFDIFNIDSKKLAKGLNEYVTGTGKEKSFTNVQIDTKKFKKLLASSLGYGYYYVRETKPGEVKVVPLLTPKDAENAVGDITSTEIKYPGPNTKQLTIKINTNSPTFGESQYTVAVRNTSGKVLPLSLRISKTK
jgi:hypothetical protein